MAKLFYQGHGSCRITTESGEVIFIDPFVGEGYDVPADLVIVTHEHYDHNKVELVTQKPGGELWRAADLLVNGVYQTKTHGSVTVRAVEAYNSRHPRSECVGCVISCDGVKVYASGDTSQTDMMRDVLPAEKLDYALLPIDGVYNMNAKEASVCAAMIGAKHSIPIHTKPGELYDAAYAAEFQAEGRILLSPGEEIVL